MRGIRYFQSQEEQYYLFIIGTYKYVYTYCNIRTPIQHFNSAVEKDMLSMDRTLRTYRKIDERIPTSIYLHLVVTEGEISKYKVV